MMKNNSSPDLFITIRTLVLMAFTGWLATKAGIFGGSAEGVAAASAVVGALYDLLAFYVKTRMKIAGIIAGALIMLTLISPRSANAQRLDIGYYLNPSTKTVQRVTSYTFASDQIKLNRQTLSIDWVALAGFDAASLTGGIGARFSFPVTRQLKLNLMPNVVITRGRVQSLSIWIGPSWRF